MRVPLKVYSYTAIRKRDMPAPEGRGHHRQVRLSVATTSQKKAAALMDTTWSDFRWHGGETGNEESVRVCMAEPEQVFWAELDDYSAGRYHRWEGQAAAAEERDRRAVSKAKFDAEVQARIEESERQRERNAETYEASKEWARRLREELGIDASASKNPKLSVNVPPEELYGQLLELIGLLRDVGIDDHPFRPTDG